MITLNLWQNFQEKIIFQNLFTNKVKPNGKKVLPILCVPKSTSVILILESLFSSRIKTKKILLNYSVN